MPPHDYVQLPSGAESPSESAHFHPDASLGDGGTRRSLQERQCVQILLSAIGKSSFTNDPTSLSMIALAGMIGTGLFLSSGQALSQAGPLGCVLGFLLVSTQAVTARWPHSDHPLPDGVRDRRNM